MRVLVTGGSGFIGTNVTESLIKAGHSVLNLDICAPQNPAHESVWRECDIRDQSATNFYFKDFHPDQLIHLAARTDLAGRTAEEYSTNTRGTENVVNAANDCAGLRRAFFASSMLVCKLGYQPRHVTDFNPTTAYGQSKAIAEVTIRRNIASHIIWAIVRPTSIWGPWFRAPYRDFFDAVEKGRFAFPTGIEVERSYGFVGNTVYILQKLMGVEENSLNSKVFYLSDFQTTHIVEWANRIADEFGVHRPRRFPLWMFRLAAQAGDVSQRLGWTSPPITSFRLGNMLTSAVYDLSALKTLVGDLPFSVADGVRETCSWMLDYRREAR